MRSNFLFKDKAKAVLLFGFGVCLVLSVIGNSLIQWDSLQELHICRAYSILGACPHYDYLSDLVISSSLLDVFTILSSAAIGALLSVDLYDRVRKQNAKTQRVQPYTFRTFGLGWYFEASGTNTKCSPCTGTSQEPFPNGESVSKMRTDVESRRDIGRIASTPTGVGETSSTRLDSKTAVPFRLK